MAEDARGRLLITLAVMSASVMQVLDTTIVNVALPQMQGELSATPDQISWVLTSYLVASGVLMPLTGYFTDRLGQRRYLMISILGFVASSLLCGLAGNLGEVVFFRLLQGAFGAPLVPLSQSVMVQTYPLEERGRAMAIWGVGIMVGPILGPTLGGYLTEVLDWRWTFFINLPVGLLSMLLTWRVLPAGERRERGMDWTGLALLSLAVGGLQFVLDRGNQEDWFSSGLIVAVSAAAVAGLLGFAWHGLRRNGQVLFHLQIFRDRNFTTGSLLLGVFGLGLFGGMILQPLMLEHLLGYPTLATGLAMAPRGIASMFSMILVGRLIGRVDPRLLMSLGILIFSAGSYAMTRYSLAIDMAWVIWPVVVQGLGLGLVFVPLSTVAFSTLPQRYSADAAGIFSLLRTIGSSIGISIVVTTLTRHTQLAWNQLGGALNPYHPALHQYLARLGLDAGDPSAAPLLAQELSRQAGMVAFVDCFVLVTWSFLAMLPLAWLMRYPRAAAARSGAPGAVPAAAE